MERFTITANQYLNKDTVAFYHMEYVPVKSTGQLSFINYFKNTYGTETESNLDFATKELKIVLLRDLPEILRLLKFVMMTVCIVPRAKADANYRRNQLLFKTTTSIVAKSIPGINDGGGYITRHTNTKTTHLPIRTPNYVNDGLLPYPGITKATCEISNSVVGKDILLVDDIYTNNRNIDEDAIQALLDAGATSVTFYAIGKTS
jgi:hypothetical protein